MSRILSVLDVVDMGIEKEKLRKEFYALVAKKFSEQDLRELFESLRDWESEHVEKFTQLRRRLIEEGRERAAVLVNVQYTSIGHLDRGQYLQAIMDNHLYADIVAVRFSKKIKTPVDALLYAISFEKDAILFFSELLNFVSSQKEIIQELLEEERQHVLYLTQLKAKYPSR